MDCASSYCVRLCNSPRLFLQQTGGGGRTPRYHHPLNMSSRAADALARMRACRDAGLPISRDLLDDMIELAERLLSAHERRRLRDRELRLAALLLPACDSPWIKAGHLVKEAKALARTRRDVADGTVLAHLRKADSLGGLPSCQKQFMRIIAASDGKWTADP